jgi:glycosyltransferase involved in cell wall biosynthesis
MKVLISAYACSTEGSECGIGWNIVNQISRQHQCWVLVNSVYKNSIEENLTQLNVDNVNFVYVDMPKPFGLLHYFYYIAWQIKAFFVAKKLCQEIDFDLVHHVTYQNAWLPSFMGWLGLPFIFDSSYLEQPPWLILKKAMSFKSFVEEILRDIIIKFFRFFSYYYIASRATLILSNYNYLPNLPVKIFCAIGLSETDLNLLNNLPPKQDQVFRIISLGRLIGWKGYTFGIKAFAKFHQQFPNSEYLFVGDGSEKANLQKLASDLGCADAVKFCGYQPRTKVLEMLSEVDCMMLPSLHDVFSTVILEAMAASKPVIALDINGPSLLVKEDCGIKVPVENVEQIVNDLSAALLELANNVEKREQMSQNAVLWVQNHWSWDKKGKELNEIYQELIPQIVKN